MRLFTIYVSLVAVGIRVGTFSASKIAKTLTTVWVARVTLAFRSTAEVLSLFLDTLNLETLKLNRYHYIIFSY